MDRCQLAWTGTLYRTIPGFHLAVSPTLTKSNSIAMIASMQVHFGVPESPCGIHQLRPLVSIGFKESVTI